MFLQSGAATVRRFLMDAYLNRGGVKAGASVDAEMFSLMKSNLRDIHSLSVNVNQIAAKINSMKGDVSDQVLGYEVKKTASYLSELSLLEERVVKIGEGIIESFFGK